MRVMDEDDEVMAPMVDALTGAMAAILLVSIFMMLSTLSGVNESIKQYGQEALYKNEILMKDVFKREPPIIELKSNKLLFFTSFKLSKMQKEKLTLYFEKQTPKKIKIYSGDEKNIITYNTLLFLNDVGLDKIIDDIEIEFLPANMKGITEFVWELK